MVKDGLPQTFLKMLPVAGLVFNALVWGVSWWPLRELQTQGLHPLWATVIIYTLALPVVLLWRPGAWRGWRRQPLLWLLALAAGLTNVGFNWAVTTGDVVRAVLLFYLMPAWSVLLAWPLLGERPGAAALLRLALALAGVTIVLKTADSPWPLPASLPDGLALAGGLAFALTNILLRRLNQTPDEARMLAMFGGGAATALAAALMGMAGGQVGAVPAPTAAWLGLAGPGRTDQRGLSAGQHRPAIRRGKAGGRHHRAGDADRSGVRQPVLGGAGRGRAERAHAAGRRADPVGRAVGGLAESDNDINYAALTHRDFLDK